MERNTTLSTVLQILTLLVSLVSAIGVLVVNSKVDQLTGEIRVVCAGVLSYGADSQVRALQELLISHVTASGLHSN